MMRAIVLEQRHVTGRFLFLGAVRSRLILYLDWNLLVTILTILNVHHIDHDESIQVFQLAQVRLLIIVDIVIVYDVRHVLCPLSSCGWHVELGRHLRLLHHVVL